MKRVFSILACVPAITGAWAGVAAVDPVPASSEARVEAARSEDHRMDWWREARFGMFIHWGIYSVPAGTWKDKVYPGAAEWLMDSAKIPVSEYEPLARQFNPVKFDAAKWVTTAKDAGQKYIVITSKHHDGFCMWGTKQTPYNIVDATPYKHDPLKDLAQECEKQGIRLGFYYSIMDWHHPDARGDNFPKYVEHMKRQLKELLSGDYGKVAVLWFDGEWIPEWTDALGKDMYDYVRSLQPDIIINNRVGKGRDGMAGLNKGPGGLGDFGTPEQEVPPGGVPGVDWETCMTMNGSWGYHAGDSAWKSESDLIRTLCETASKGGNFLLNVGPTAEGEIPAESVERLQAMGRWMDVNHEAIYGTSASPIPPYFWGDTTVGNGTLYVMVYEWPEDGWLRLRGVFTKVAGATLLATGTELAATGHPYGTSVRIPMAGRDRAATVVKLKLDAPIEVRARVIPQLNDDPVKPNDSRNITLSIFDARIEGTKARLERGFDKRCLGFWTDRGDYVSWDVDIKRPGLYKLILDAASVAREGGGTYRIVLGDEMVDGRVPSTGKWNAFARFNPPPFMIREPGRYTLVIKPIEIDHGGGLMNLRGAYLQFQAELDARKKPEGTP